jgi:hypothetical protein
VHFYVSLGVQSPFEKTYLLSVLLSFVCWKSIDCVYGLFIGFVPFSLFLFIYFFIAMTLS